MSLKSELSELIDWLAASTSEESSAPPRVPLPRDDWRRVRDNLESAADAFKAAGDLVAGSSGESPKTVTADLAFDLGLEAQALADRAYLLGRRARPKVDKSADELAIELARKTASNESLTRKVTSLEAEVKLLESKAPVAARKPVHKQTQSRAEKVPADHIDTGERSVATARDNLFSVTPAEQAVVDFAEDLEILNDLITGWRRVARRNA